MPKVISYTPPWLFRPNPGFQLFASTPPTLSPSHSKRKNARGPSFEATNGARTTYEGPRRILARRGTEIFVVADNQIRWSDLCMLKDDWEGEERRKRHRRTEANGPPSVEKGDDEADSAKSYRVLEASFGETIRQLSVSPNGRYLAIVTSHTTHVALLPESSQLGQNSHKPIPLKPRMIGPTTHVLSQSPLASVLWHPCGVDGSCLVTVTEDAAVRVWELNFKDHWSFDTPSLAIDLTKLACGVSEHEDFRPYKMTRNRGFSIDGIGMIVAAACFGGTGSSDESPWSAMTLWIAMKEGDVYALCPLLPGKWQPSSTTLPSLSASAISKKASIEEGSPPSEEAQQCEDQYRWISDLDNQDPRIIPAKDPFSSSSEIYNRPLRPTMPKLQGPFQFLAQDEVDLDLSDIHVIAAKVDGDELMHGEEPDSDSGLGMDDEAGISASIICLLTRSGRVYICVDLLGVEGQWLPSSRQIEQPRAYDELYLTTVEILDTLTLDADPTMEWPTFSPDEHSRYSFFVTHSQSVFFFSLEPWVQNLENELQSTASVGTAFRIDILANSSGTLRERIIDLRQYHEARDCKATAAIVLQDSDLGYFLLTAVNDVPLAAILDQPNLSPVDELDLVTSDDLEQSMDMLALRPARSPYVPPSSLWERSALPGFLDRHVQNRHKKALKEEIRLSSATLDLMTHAHRVLSQETHTLGVAAADLFRRCERLQDELRDQIYRVKEASNRIDQLIDTDVSQDGDGEKPETGTAQKADQDKPKTAIETRLDDARARQQKLLDRFHGLRSTFTRCQGQDLNEKEKTWVADTQRLRKSLIPPDEEESHSDEEQIQEPWQRLEEAKRLARDLIAHAKEASDDVEPKRTETFSVPPELRKARMGQVMKLLERESALVDAAQMRLERLSLASVS